MSPQLGRNMNRFILLSVVLLIVCSALAVCVGPNESGFWIEIPETLTLLKFRLPRVILGAFVGIGLSLSGAVLQSLTKNELASPYTLGVSSAAALGSSLAIFLQLSAYLIPILAIIFCLLALGFVVSIYYRQLHSSKEYVLLIGVSLGFLCSSLIVGMQFFGGAEISFSIQKWLIGSLQVVGFSSCLILAPVVALATLIFAYHGSSLDILQFGSEFATSKGVNVKNVGVRILITVALLVGVIVSMVGPIAFVGLLLPQIVKLYVNSIHRYVLWYSALYGATFLVVIDSMSRVILAPSEVPVGVLSSLVGAPIFVALILKGSKASA